MQRDVLTLLAAVIMMGCIAGATTAARAQVPGSLSRYTGQSQFSAQQRSEIRAYAEHWAQRLASDDPAEVASARQALVEPLRNFNVTAIFRTHYGSALVPPLRDVIEQAGPLVTRNAINVLTEVGTEAALTHLAELTGAGEAAQWPRRLAAAQGVTAVLSRHQRQEQPVETLRDVARTISRAAAEETNRWALERQLEALAVANEVARERIFDPGLIEEIEKWRLEAFTKVIQQMKQHDGPDERFAAFYPALFDMHIDYFLPMTVAHQETFGRKILPVLTEILTVPEQHWQAAQADERHREVYGDVIRSTEDFMEAIDTVVRTGGSAPDTSLEEAWDHGQLEQFAADRSQWEALVSQPPHAD